MKYAKVCIPTMAIVSLPPGAIFNFKIHFPLKYSVIQRYGDCCTFCLYGCMSSFMFRNAHCRKNICWAKSNNRFNFKYMKTHLCIYLWMYKVGIWLVNQKPNKLYENSIILKSLKHSEKVFSKYQMLKPNWTWRGSR